ncbi:MAG: DUF1822 family protein, partial [Microcoleus sp. SIO2G3]|nr:DUF1822 family protein [Microcoleus sp. SIO2G3]
SNLGLFFYLRFLQPNAVALPATGNCPTRASLTQQELDTVLSNLHSPEQRLWQSLTWEQGAILLACPELVNLLYHWQTQAKQRASLSIRIRELITLLTHKAVNAARWLQGEMDELAQNLELFFTPASSGLLSINQFEVAIAQLKHQGIDIPNQVRPTYQNINLDGIPLRLCALVWSVASEISPPQWSLLLILGTQTGDSLPDDLKLQVSNLTGILQEPISDLDDQFLFAHVEGDWSEKFVVTIVPLDCPPLMLSPYTFEPEQAPN